MFQYGNYERSLETLIRETGEHAFRKKKKQGKKMEGSDDEVYSEGEEEENWEDEELFEEPEDNELSSSGAVPKRKLFTIMEKKEIVNLQEGVVSHISANLSLSKGDAALLLQLFKYHRIFFSHLMIPKLGLGKIVASLLGQSHSISRKSWDVPSTKANPR